MNIITLHQLIRQEHIQLLDVRGASEYAAGYIEGAKNIPLGYLERHLREIPTDRAIAVQCQTGARSAIAVSILMAHGFKQSIDILGGFAAWQKTSNPVKQESIQ
jgi:hydroxyacylglutathione hydrolase